MTLDFAHVLGQHAVKRALEIAAAGGHNVPALRHRPARARAWLAKRFSTILPPLSDMRTAGGHPRLVGRRPRRRRQSSAPNGRSARRIIIPRPTQWLAARAAAGRLPVPGEITLAHRGVLFLDELPEFRRDVLETLRQPLEDGKADHLPCRPVRSRIRHDFQLIAAMNPCHVRLVRHGTAAPAPRLRVQQYLHRLSGPLLDRIDLQVAVQPVEYAALAARRSGQ